MTDPPLMMPKSSEQDATSFLLSLKQWRIPRSSCVATNLEGAERFQMCQTASKFFPSFASIQAAVLNSDSVLPDRDGSQSFEGPMDAIEQHVNLLSFSAPLCEMLGIASCRPEKVTLHISLLAVRPVRCRQSAGCEWIAKDLSRHRQALTKKVS